VEREGKTKVKVRAKLSGKPREEEEEEEEEEVNPSIFVGKKRKMNQMADTRLAAYTHQAN
jgi:hypothetical protein